MLHGVSNQIRNEIQREPVGLDFAGGAIAVKVTLLKFVLDLGGLHHLAGFQGALGDWVKRVIA